MTRLTRENEELSNKNAELNQKINEEVNIVNWNWVNENESSRKAAQAPDQFACQVPNYNGSSF